jgi:hypothetical protein
MPRNEQRGDDAMIAMVFGCATATGSGEPLYRWGKASQPRHGLALTVQVGLHLGKPLDGLDPVPEPRTGQVPVDHFHLGLLAFAG